MTLPTWALEKARILTPCTHPVTSYSCPMSWNSCGRTKTCDLRDDIAAALIEAERRGAERMREKADLATLRFQDIVGHQPGESRNRLVGDIAERIRALPLDEESGS